MHKRQREHVLVEWLKSRHVGYEHQPARRGSRSQTTMAEARGWFEDAQASCDSALRIVDEKDVLPFEFPLIDDRGCDQKAWE
jgi:hypothetical protein